MEQFENEFSNFPAKKIVKHNFKNVDDNIAPLVNQINSFQLIKAVVLKEYQWVDAIRIIRDWIAFHLYTSYPYVSLKAVNVLFILFNSGGRR